MASASEASVGGVKRALRRVPWRAVRLSRIAVVGVRALTPEGFATFRAKSIVLACGSFEANPEMRARYLGPGWDMVHIRGVPFNTGDGLRMAMNIGAMPHGSWSTCHASPQDVALPPCTIPVSYTTKRSYARYMYPYPIMVNMNGERFIDEGEDLRDTPVRSLAHRCLSLRRVVGELHQVAPG